MQRYGKFRLIPNIWANFGGSCCDAPLPLRQICHKDQESCRKAMKMGGSLSLQQNMEITNRNYKCY